MVDLIHSQKRMNRPQLMLVELPQGEEGLDLLALGREERAAREGSTAPRERGQRERDAGPGLERFASRSQVNNFPNLSN